MKKNIKTCVSYLDEVPLVELAMVLLLVILVIAALLALAIVATEGFGQGLSAFKDVVLTGLAICAFIFGAMRFQHTRSNDENNFRQREWQLADNELLAYLQLCRQIESLHSDILNITVEITHPSYLKTNLTPDILLKLETLNGELKHKEYALESETDNLKYRLDMLCDGVSQYYQNTGICANETRSSLYSLLAVINAMPSTTEYINTDDPKKLNDRFNGYRTQFLHSLKELRIAQFKAKKEDYAS